MKTFSKILFIVLSQKHQINISFQRFPTLSLVFQTVSGWFFRWFFQTLPHGLDVDNCLHRSWSITISFICTVHMSCFPELMQKIPDCESTWRCFFRKVNCELSLYEGYQFWFKVRLHGILLSIHWGKNWLLRCWYSWKWKKKSLLFWKLQAFKVITVYWSTLQELMAYFLHHFYDITC